MRISKSIRAYLPFLLISAKQQMVYRGRILIKLVNHLLMLIAMSYLWTTALEGNAQRGYTPSTIIIYFLFIMLGGVLFTYEPCFVLGAAIQNSTLMQDLIKPIDYFTKGLYTQIGRQLPWITLSGVLVLILSPQAPLILLYMFISFYMYFALMMLASLLAFYLEEMWPLHPIIAGISMLCGGVMFPLDLLPPSVFKIVQYNPFALIGYRFSYMLSYTPATSDMLYWSAISLAYGLIAMVLFRLGFRALYHRYEGVGA